MSHTVTVKAVEMKNVECLDKAIKALGLTDLGTKRHQLFSNQSAVGRGVKLEGWSYPVVIDTEKGTASYDNYGGSWGKQEKLDELVQEYTRQTMIAKAAEEGYSYEQQTLANGDVELLLTEYATA